MLSRNVSMLPLVLEQSLSTAAGGFSISHDMGFVGGVPVHVHVFVGHNKI